MIKRKIKYQHLVFKHKKYAYDFSILIWNNLNLGVNIALMLKYIERKIRFISFSARKRSK